MSRQRAGVDGLAEPSLVAWARRVAGDRLGDSGARWQHTLGVAQRAKMVADSLSTAGENAVLVAAAYLHDVGRAAGIVASGFHPLDGAQFLRSLGKERLACLVAYHSGAQWEAELRGLGPQLGAFPRELSSVADALTYCDMTTGPHGERLSLDERCEEIRERYPRNSEVVLSLELAGPELMGAVARTEALLARGAVA